jgi:hypothetical protein
MSNNSQTTSEADGFVLVGDGSETLRVQLGHMLSKTLVVVNQARGLMSRTYASCEERFTNAKALLLSKAPSMDEVAYYANSVLTHLKSSQRSRIAIYALVFSMLLSMLLMPSSHVSKSHRMYQMDHFPNNTWPKCERPKNYPVVNRNTFTEEFHVCEKQASSKKVAVAKTSYSQPTCQAPLKCAAKKPVSKSTCSQFDCRPKCSA